jgi:hypothetical protein
LQDFKQNNIATPAPSTQNIKMLNWRLPTTDK